VVVVGGVVVVAAAAAVLHIPFPPSVTQNTQSNKDSHGYCKDTNETAQIVKQ
jgi:hypothetical protein